MEDFGIDYSLQKEGERLFTESEVGEIVGRKIEENFEEEATQKADKIKKTNELKRELQYRLMKVNGSIKANRKKLALSFGVFACSAVLFLGSVSGFGHLLIGNTSKQNKKGKMADEAMRNHPTFVQTYERDKSIIEERFEREGLTNFELNEALSKIETDKYMHEVLKREAPEDYETFINQKNDAQRKSVLSSFFGFFGLVGGGVCGAGYMYVSKEDAGNYLKKLRENKQNKKEINEELKDL